MMKGRNYLKAGRQLKLFFGKGFFEHFIFNPLTTNVPHHIETSQLICNVNQLTGFYMMGNTGR